MPIRPAPDRARVSVRPYRRADAAATLEVFRRAIAATAGVQYTPDQVAAWLGDEVPVEEWHGARARRTTFVATDEGDHAIGFGDLDASGHVDVLFVHPDHGRRGVGAALLEAIVAVARSSGVRELTVEASLAARPLFAAAGFAVVAEQAVPRAGQTLTNFRMRRSLTD